MIGLIPTPYRYLAMAGAAAALLSLSYCKGNTDGRNAVAAKYLKRDILLRQRMDAVREDINKVGGAYASARTSQETETREIFHESIRVIEKPVYHVTCGDADAGRLFDHARTNANRSLTGGASFTPARAASNAP